MKIIVCIPARYASTRFPAKVLANDTGKFLIQHTYEQARKAKLPSEVIIAADDTRILEAAESFGANCILTSPDCQSGTDRIAQAVEKLNAERCPLSADDIVINVQADEPEIDPAHIDYVADLLVKTRNSKQKTNNYSMATLAAPFSNDAQIADPNIVKVIVTSDEVSRAIYFSRSVIPYDRNSSGIGPKDLYLRHLGIYAYRKDFLLCLTKLPQTPLEKSEKLEQLRVIENGFEILVGRVEKTADGIDTPEQYAEFVKRYKKTLL